MHKHDPQKLLTNQIKNHRGGMMTASNWIIRESGATRSLMKEKWHWSAKAKNRVLQNTPRKPAELLMLEMDRVTPVDLPANRNSKKREPRQKSWLQCHFLSSLFPFCLIWWITCHIPKTCTFRFAHRWLMRCTGSLSRLFTPASTGNSGKGTHKCLHWLAVV